MNGDLILLADKKEEEPRYANDIFFTQCRVVSEVADPTVTYKYSMSYINEADELDEETQVYIDGYDLVTCYWT